MQDARYFRSQAELCFAMSQQMSDGKAAAYLQALAERYQEQAAALESAPRLVSSSLNSSSDD